MQEKLYTIPVNEAFDAGIENPAAGCPFCALYNRFEQTELETILGAAMMEPDIRIMTNREGFCRTHYEMMLHRKNRLPMALTLESHLAEIENHQAAHGLGDLRQPGAAAGARIDALLDSCYVCRRIDTTMQHMTDTAVYLWDKEAEFRKKTAAQPYFCLPHYRAFLKMAQKMLSKKQYAAFYAALSAQEHAALEKLHTDVSWFCKKFDYRYNDEPWGDSRDAVERATRMLRGDLHRDPSDKSTAKKD